MAREASLRRPLIAVLALCALVRATHAGAEVGDGDGIRFGTKRIRLWGMDAPELDQECKRDRAIYRCGEQTHAAVKSSLAAGNVRCQAIDRDRYRRTVARCCADGRDLGAEMVRHGWAIL